MLEQEAGHAAKALRRDAHAALRVAVGGVEAGGDEQQGGGEGLEDGQHDEAHRREVVRVRIAIRPPRHVEGCPQAGAFARLVGGARLGVPPLAVAMEGDVEDARVVVEDGLRPVAVVHVPVQNRHLARRAALEHHAGRHRHRIEKAKALGVMAVGVVGARVVAGRAHERKRGGRALLVALGLAQHGARRVDDAAARQPRCRIRLGRVVHAARPVGLAQLSVGRVSLGRIGHSLDLVDVAL